MDKNKLQNNKIPRSPVVVVMGHIDHGKSTLLDYIRKTNVVGGEAGSITQHISAYEVIHKDEHGKDRAITFLDTPGHEAFSKMRERGAAVADIAILVVSAEDSVKPQTIEAWKTIVASNTPAIVAINKIDKPGANVDKTKMDLAQNEIFLENYGGKVPFELISAKTGEGIDKLLSLILTLAELEELTGEIDKPALGYLIEASLDPKRGIQATLIIKDGSLARGMTVAAEDAICSTRIIENFLGKMINGATFSSPIRLVGWDKMPKVGSKIQAFAKKSEAEEYAQNFKDNLEKKASGREEGNDKKIIPIVLKADVAGSLEAIEKEINKIKSDGAQFKIIQQGTGPVSEGDIKNIAGENGAMVIGFNVKADKNATELAETRGIAIGYFDIIYKMTEWLTEEMEKRRPRIATEETTGEAKILKAFSRTKEKQIMGGKVLAGKIVMGSYIKIMRRDFEIGQGKIVNLERNKEKVGNVEEGSEFGMMLESKIEIVPGDTIKSVNVVQK
jgi:translation initiation factor IF-2